MYDIETDVNAAEEALRYTIFLCDAEKLYNVALGMYNFPLVLMVAQQAQKVHSIAHRYVLWSSKRMRSLGSSWIFAIFAGLAKAGEILSTLQDWWSFEALWKSLKKPQSSGYVCRVLFI